MTASLFLYSLICYLKVDQAVKLRLQLHVMALGSRYSLQLHLP